METTSAFDVPVLMVMFNRPNLALQVLSRIRIVKPLTLYLAVDGPRQNRPTDNVAVAQCQAIENQIDWPCTVKTLYRQENLGCRKAVSGAINWFFEQVPYGIILEDDCLPDATFFDYCKTLLLKYENEQSVMHISGCNLFKGLTWDDNSYFFTKIVHIWGWATWRRAWALYDVDMSTYPKFEHKKDLDRVITYVPARPYFKYSFQETYAGRCDTWDYQWGICYLGQRWNSYYSESKLDNKYWFW